MIKCSVQGELVDYDKICTHWTLWNKTIGAPLSYTITISFDEIEAVFNEYWIDVIDRESDPELDDGFEITGIETELKSANYPSLSKMLREYSELFCKYVMKHLQTEFIGYVVDGRNNSCSGKDFSLHNINTLEIVDGNVYISGKAQRCSN